ncbi:hypothetical protein STEG23_002567, partial [Scotinomys teguina]
GFLPQKSLLTTDRMGYTEVKDINDLFKVIQPAGGLYCEHRYSLPAFKRKKSQERLPSTVTSIGVISLLCSTAPPDGTTGVQRRSNDKWWERLDEYEE